jgi:plasmid replication initiation protein
MTTQKRRAKRAYLGGDQFDLFHPYLTDLPLRDQREMMERPFFSLAKSKRQNPSITGLPMGSAYELLGQSVDRLVSTTVKTYIRADNRREAAFSWIDGWTQLVDEKTERSRGMTIELSNWFCEGVMMTGGVLAIERAYFRITGDRERWLYRVARKHAGGAGEKKGISTHIDCPATVAKEQAK